MKRAVILLCVLCALCGSIYAANEIRSFTNCSAAFAVVREIDGDIWYVSSQVFEAFGTDGRTMLDYDIALTAESGGMFTGTFDTNISAGQYYVVTHDDADSTPADTDPAVWQEYGDWDGSIWTPGTFSPADIESEVNDALVALNLDHLMKIAVNSNSDMTTEVTDGTVLSNIMTSDSDTSGYVVADDSLEALSDRQVLIKYKTDLITIHDDTIKTANDANNFILNAGKDADGAFDYHIIMVTDADDSNTELRYIASWYDDGGTDPNVTVERPFSFTPASGDVVHIMGTGYGGWLRYLMNLFPGQTDVFDFRATAGGGGTVRLNAEDDDP